MRARRTAPISSVFVTGCAGSPSPGGQARPRDPKCAIAYAIVSDSIVAVGLSDCAADAVPCGLAWRVLPRLRLRCNRFRGGRIVSVCRVSCRHPHAFSETCCIPSDSIKQFPDEARVPRRRGKPAGTDLGGALGAPCAAF